MVYFLIPVFNEAANLALLFENLRNCLPGVPKLYVFSDDGSSDETVKMIHAAFREEEAVVLGDGKNHGPGHAFNIGFEWILKRSGDANDRIITIEADNTSDISLLPKMLAISGQGYSLVLASVYAQGGGFDKTSLWRRFLSSIANLLMRFAFDVRVQTLSSFYRVYHPSLVRDIQKKYGVIIREPGFLCMIEVLIKAIRVNACIIEVPMMLYSQKRKGKSKMKKFRTSLQYLRFILRNRY